MISSKVYFPALGGMRLRMSGRLGNIGRMNPGILSYIDWTPAMISFASFSSILLPLRAVFMLLALMFYSDLARRNHLGHIQVRQTPRVFSLRVELIPAWLERFLFHVGRPSKNTDLIGYETLRGRLMLRETSLGWGRP